MRLHIAILVLITVIAQTTTEDLSGSSSIEHLEDGRLSTSQGWDQSDDPGIYREEYEVEPEMNKRLRNRGGKRRRRLRQRIRTTERPPDIDNSDELHTAASSLERAENEELPAAPRRRPSGKRRRRPLRRYYENEQTIVRPRRRKGGRKRIRPQVLNTDDFETTTFIPLDYDSPTTIKVTSGEIIKTESTTEMSDKHEEVEDKHYFIEKAINNRTENTPANTTMQDKKKPNQVPKDDRKENREFNNELTEPINKEENAAQNQGNEESEFGHKIFERKNLFSNSRRLPETSATLRRRLIPRIKNATSVSHMRIIKPLANLESELESRQFMKNDSSTQKHIPKISTETPELNESYQSRNKINSQTPNEQNFEEPNYPKLELFIRKNKTVEKTFDEIKVSTTPTEDYPMTTTEITPEETTQFLAMDIKSSTENLAASNNSILKIPNLDDELFELLNSEAGRNRLQRILEIRNMTLAQLLDHRERGSSKFHLSDIFSKSQTNSNEKLQTTKEDVNIAHNISKEHKDTPENLLSDEFLKPPPIENDHNSVPIYNPTKYLNNYNLEKEPSLASNQYRESRIFDSLPEFTTTKPPVPEVRSYPTWRIIPNPKLKPVSVRGDYKEIKISNIYPSNKPELDNEIDKIFLLEERDNLIERRNNVVATSTIADHRQTTPFLFRKIPYRVD
ncbi:hypothetical protein O3M35_001031 [Rhynocoris fuscipes]|uniref:Uncharacterized protein n=1 Tax=Rhynocoris fuscipes TaxID=488301 RepID=A0AAW1DTR5_9HEMI